MERSQFKMVHRSDRIDVFSEKEYERRIGQLRALMREKGVEVLVFLETSEETYAQWLLGVRFLEYMIVPQTGDITGVLWNEIREETCTVMRDTDYERYVIQKPKDPVCGGIRFVNRGSDAEIVKLIAEQKPQRVGFVASKRMTAAFYDAFTEKLPGVETTEMSVDVALLRAIKSEEELNAIQITRDAQVGVFRMLPDMIREGRTAEDITHEMRHMLLKEGASGVMSCQLVNHGPSDDTLSESYGVRNRKIRKGGRMFAIMEANAMGQQHVAFGRQIMFGEPTDFMLKANADEEKALKYASGLLKPDGKITLAQIAVKTRKYINGLGYELQEQVGWNWMHGLGSFFYEQYSLEDYTEDIPIREGIILHCHPKMYSYYQDEMSRWIRREVFLLNTFYITKDGPQDLIRVPYEPVILN